MSNTTDPRDAVVAAVRLLIDRVTIKRVSGNLTAVIPNANRYAIGSALMGVHDALAQLATHHPLSDQLAAAKAELARLHTEHALFRDAIVSFWVSSHSTKDRVLDCYCVFCEGAVSLVRGMTIEDACRAIEHAGYCPVPVAMGSEIAELEGKQGAD